ncbi:MAG TPA: hypothetical protein VFB14_12260 [Bryobacteraceae bacterium]|nr:hypothetical protein [Bryobacteraceae bacterium]
MTAVTIMITSSFDVFLVIQAGANFRFCQIATVPLLALAFLRIGREKILPTLGLGPLLLWLAFQLIFFPIADFWLKSVGYCFWLILDIGLIFSFVQLFGDDRRRIQTLIRWYAISFAIVAAFAILQFVLPLFGYPSPFVTEWWIKDQLARANGFSYEPSYLGTYLLIGFVFVGALIKKPEAVLSQHLLRSVYWLCALGIIVSSSRMALIFLFLDIALRHCGRWLRVTRDVFHRRLVRANILALIPSCVLFIVAAVLVTVGVMVWERNPAAVLLFLNGTGVSDTAAHSVIQRESAFSDTLTVFAEHPLIGESLGGVSSGIAALHAYTVHSFEDSKPFEGMNIFAEALAASGVIGILPFIWFLIETTAKPLNIARQVSPSDSVLIRASVRALLFTWAILQFNQNILRPYLWVHLAVLAAVCAAAQRLETPEDACVAGMR